MNNFKLVLTRRSATSRQTGGFLASARLAALKAKRDEEEEGEEIPSFEYMEGQSDYDRQQQKQQPATDPDTVVC